MLEIMNAQLEGNDYFLGKEFTMVDIPFGILAYRYFALIKETPDTIPNVKAWYDRISKREQFIKHVTGFPLTWTRAACLEIDWLFEYRLYIYVSFV